MIRRRHSFPGVSLSLGRNPRSYAPGHWHIYPDYDHVQQSHCRCGATEWPHEGQYASRFYAQNSAYIGLRGWFMLSAWANNAGSYGAYYSIGDRVFRPFWKARGRRSRSGLTFEVIGHSSKEDYGSGKVHGLRLQWSEL